MALAEDESTRDVQLGLRKLLGDLLKPVRVKGLVITGSDKYTVRGFVVTVCPIEKTEAGRDFEVGLEGNHEGSILYVSVDGKRMLPKRAGQALPNGALRARVANGVTAQTAVTAGYSD